MIPLSCTNVERGDDPPCPPEVEHDASESSYVAGASSICAEIASVAIARAISKSAHLKI
jgi:hypothetical protein